MFVSSALFFRRKDISILFWVLFSFGGFCIFSSPRMDRVLVFSTTDFFRSVSRDGCISSLYVRVRPSPSPPKMTETTHFLLCPWDLSATGLFPAKPKDSVVPQRGNAQCSHPEMGWGPPREGWGWLFLPCPSSSFPFGGPGSGFHSDLYPLTW